jgi:hypothetical protein
MPYVLVGLPLGVGGLAILFYLNFILVCFQNTHQVLVRQPQGVGGLAIFNYFILVYFNNTHQVILEFPQGVAYWLFCFI